MNFVVYHDFIFYMKGIHLHNLVKYDILSSVCVVLKTRIGGMECFNLRFRILLEIPDELPVDLFDCYH